MKFTNRKSKIAILLVLLFLLLTAIPVSAQSPTPTPEPSLPAVYAEPPPSPGWVPVMIILVESGCYGTECASTWTPDPQKYLFEFKADRTNRGAGEGDGSPPSGLPVRDPRARCMGQWAAGKWYHNAIWTTYWTQEHTRWGTRWVEHWNGSPNWEGWNFAEDDRCPQATPTPRPMPTPTRTDPDEQCPDTRTTTTPPTSRVWFEPPYPVVIAQDPGKKGVNVNIQVTTYPVHYEWQEWQVVSTERKCRYKDPDSGAKCYNCEPGCGCYTSPIPCDAEPVWENWKWKTVDKYGCKWHDTWVPEPIDTGSISVQAILMSESREWITQELAQRYPGLGLRHPDWNNLRASWDVSYFDDMTYVATAVVNIPVEDPGIYDFSMAGRTSGTPYSGSQSFGFNRDFAVNFLGETLVK